jgi:hypothetical protein
MNRVKYEGTKDINLETWVEIPEIDYYEHEQTFYYAVRKTIINN